MRGLRNNNPGNIRTNNDKFLGEIQPSSDKSFKTFEKMSFGYRAIFVVLGTYLSRGVNSIEKIITTWAPSLENDTESYIKTVEKNTGINRHQLLSSKNGDDFIKIVAAISYQENGVKAVMDDVIAGFNLQTKITR